MTRWEIVLALLVIFGVPALMLCITRFEGGHEPGEFDPQDRERLP